MSNKSLLMIILIMTAVSIIGCNTANQEVNQEKPEVEVDSFPSKNITIVVPFPPGGANDVSARLMSIAATKYLDGKKIIVENREGGGAVIGQTYVADAPSDGYTLLAHTTSAVSNTYTSSTTYTVDSFTPIAMFSIDPEILVVPADSQFEDLHDFLEKTKQEKVIFTTPGHSTSHHIAGVILKEEHDLNIDFSHTNGAPQMIQQLLGNHVDASLMSYGEIQSQIADGLLRVLGVMSAERMEHMPDVPTFKEVGIDMEYGPFRGIAAPAGISEEVTQELEHLFEQIINDPEFISSMKQSGYDVEFRGSQAYREVINTSAQFIEKALPLLEAEANK